ncbi:hypothetical protein CY658_02955 [Variovorax sp. RO1]|uniref:hypothetical protein n=1 Tax=Variovorax sp. RO1 TaxID=2066034 RepID=UPI000CB19EE7|nr:hypothetical protein [Variovorax sp. RO1]PLC06025.1 hypothetical protein CY658_02955 [Variovorax sp. RO1]
MINSEYVRSIARHEAAHWIMGKRFGAGVGAITLKFTHEPGTSSVRLDCHAAVDRIASTKTVPEIEEYFRQRVRASMAGAIAQLPPDVGVTIPAVMGIWENEGQDDYMKIREFCQILRNIQYGEADRQTAKTQLNEISEALFLASVNDVQENKEPIKDLAEHMASAVTEFNKSYVFSSAAISSIPSIQALFPLAQSGS